MLAVQTMKYASAAPTSADPTYHEAGEILFNAAPAKGDVIGWVCLTAGTPGTWVAITPVVDNSYTTVAAGSTLSAYSRYVSVEDAGTVTLGATSLFPSVSPITYRAVAASVTIVPAGGQIDGAANKIIGAAAHVTLIHSGGSVWYSVAS